MCHNITGVVRAPHVIGEVARNRAEELNSHLAAQPPSELEHLQGATCPGDRTEVDHSVRARLRRARGNLGGVGHDGVVPGEAGGVAVLCEQEADASFGAVLEASNP